MSVYKKFSPLDYATVPFNAHKQYTFNSSSAVSNKITVFDTKWTKENIGIYSSGSKSGSWERNDKFNTIKYNQLDHLFYRNFKLDVNNRLGDNHYLKQRRVLYENANILSIPAGLYGHQIKPGSFFLSSSDKVILDDKEGNLIRQGTDTTQYITDPRANVLNIGPVKGFKLYDLNTIDGYLDGFEGNNVFYKDGEPRVNPTYDSYSSKEFLPQGKYDHDDSYYFNNIEYKNVTFSEKQLADFDRFPSIEFNGSSSEFIMGHDDKFNYNKGDDFTIMFFLASGSAGSVLNSDGVTNYVLSKSTTKTIIPSPNEGTAGIARLQSTGSSQPIDVFSEPQYPFEIYLKHDNGSPYVFFERSDGNITTTVSASFNTSSEERTQLNINNQTNSDFITSSINTNNVQNLLNNNESDYAPMEVKSSTKNDFINGGGESHPNSFANPNGVQQSGRDIKLDFDMLGMDGTSPIITEIEVKFQLSIYSHGKIQISGSNDGSNWEGIAEENRSINLGGALSDIHQLSSERFFKFPNTNAYKWYRLRFEENGFLGKFKANTELFNTSLESVVASPTDYFDSIDGLDDNGQPNLDFKFSISELRFYTGNKIPHVACRASSSEMQIFIDGKPSGVSKIDNSVQQTQNTANLYIGSKGGKTNYLTGSLSQINIFNRALTNIQVNNHYESSDGSPYVGNIFYSTGMVAITHPGVEESVISNPGIGNMIVGENFFIGTNAQKSKYFGIHELKFQGSHLIYEHEYQCTLDEHEFTDTLNPSARKIRSHQSPDLADFATGSLFKPYITTVGLYNENNELLVVGKLGQPIRTSDETDTTLIVRWDT